MTTDRITEEKIRIVVDAEAPVEAPVKAPVETAVEAPVETPVEASLAGPLETSVEATVSKHLYTLEAATKGLFLTPNHFLSWVWNVRAPLLVLAAIAAIHKLVLLWLLFVVAKPIAIWTQRKLPESWKANLQSKLPKSVTNSPLLRDLNEGADQGLPFVLFWLYLCCAPFALGWMVFDWIKGFFPSPPAKPLSEDRLLFKQNAKTPSVDPESNFYHSRAFGLVVFCFFALGIPAFFSFAAYEHLGIERLMETSPSPSFPKVLNPTTPPRVEIPQVGISSYAAKSKAHGVEMYAEGGDDVTVVAQYNGYWPWLKNIDVVPTKHSVFFVHFYLLSLASCLSVLFFRTWFTFPLNFLSDEHEIELTEYGIKRKSFKGWFSSVITMNRFAVGGGPDSLQWDEIKSLRRFEEGFTKLYPLPETAFKKESLTYKLLNKVAAFIDGLSNRTNPANYVVFSAAETGSDFGTNIKVNLNELNREQRARLFYAAKKWAPHAVVNQAAEEQLLGSTVLRHPRYTQLWFDMLTTRTPRKPQNVLVPGESLKSETYTIDERISSGGQATTYLASKTCGEKCVLKEFILSTSPDSAVLIESAREFEAEVSLLSQLNHPGIVQLQDYFFEQGRVYVVMEHIAGQSLRQKVQQSGPLTEKEVIQISESICEVLEYLHNCNPPIVHRDITPENILIQPNSEVKLIDFSLAVRQDGRPTTESCAKQAFTPPEQFREEACVQSDLYALGATMHYLLTGVAPKPISRSSPKTKAPHVSEDINAIVQRATELDLNLRYESAHWFKLDLGRLRQRQVIKSHP